jgi:hypothetical protein
VTTHGDCLLCGNTLLRTDPLYSKDGGVRTAALAHCRTCGTYAYTTKLKDTLIGFPATFSTEQKQRLSAITRAATEADKTVELTTSASDLLDANPPPTVPKQCDLLLDYIAKRTQPGGKPVPLEAEKDYPIAFAPGPEGLRFLINSMMEEGLLKRTDTSSIPQYRITLKGYRFIEDRRQASTPSPITTPRQVEPDALPDLTEAQRTFLLEIGKGLATGLYLRQMDAYSAFGDGWSLLLTPRSSGLDSLTIGGFEETDLHALQQYGYITLLPKKDTYSIALTAKAEAALNRPQPVRKVTAPMPAPEVTVGSRIGRFEILDRLGAGGMGEVFKARDTQIDEIVALKTVRTDSRRFLDEVKLARKVTHPGVCRVHDIYEENGLLFFTMEFVPGTTLKDHLKQVGKLPPKDAAALGVQIVEALGAIHAKGIAHRDLKPSNIMLDAEGQIRIMDLGVAKDLDPEKTRTDTNAIVGSPQYMSPEQFRNQRPDSRSDIYSLGIVIYELTVGAHPFPGPPEMLPFHHMGSPLPFDTDSASSLPESLKRTLLRCTEKEPGRRFATAAEVAAALREVT